MPFLPSSPTRLYPEGRIQPSRKVVTQPSLAVTDEIQISMEIKPPPVEANGLIKAEETSHASPIPNRNSSHRSMSLWNDLTVGRFVGRSILSKKVHRDGTSEEQQNDAKPAEKTENATDGQAQAPGDGRITVLESEPFEGSQQFSGMHENTPVSEYLVGNEAQPVIGRASSIRVSRPQIIQHNPSIRCKPVSGSSIHSRSSSHSSLKGERIFGHRPDMLPSMPEESGQKAPIDGISSIASKDSQEDKQSGSRRTSSATTISKMPSDHGKNGPEAGRTSPGLPTTNTLHPHQESISNAGSSTDEPTNKSNESAMGTSRAMASPLPLLGRSLRQRVTIRPADVVIQNYTRDSSCGESVVATPYPARISIDAGSMKDEEDEEKEPTVAKKGSVDAFEKRKAKSKEKQVSSTGVPAAKDRFPSPERPEVLFLDLSLQSRPEARTTIEIHISDRGSFDDEMLFEQIRTAYFRQMLGLLRLPFALLRRASYATISAPANYDASDFDNTDFVRHFRNPWHGRRRKVWVDWLRGNNQRAVAPANLSHLTHPNTNGSPVGQIDDLNRLGLHTRGFGYSGRPTWDEAHHTDMEVEENKRLNAVSDASSLNFVYPPAVPRLPFLSTRHDNINLASPGAANAGSPCRSYFLPHNFSSSSASRSGNAEESKVKIVMISFHHGFRLSIIAPLTALVILQAVLAAIIWVVFGVPGTRPGMDGKERIGAAYLKTDWRVDAQARILAGVVIGVICLLLGGFLEGMMIWSSAYLL